MKTRDTPFHPTVPDNHPTPVNGDPGITLREEVALRFATAIIARPNDGTRRPHPEETIRLSFVYADEFLRQSNRT